MGTSMNNELDEDGDPSNDDEMVGAGEHLTTMTKKKKLGFNRSHRQIERKQTVKAASILNLMTDNAYT